MRLNVCVVQPVPYEPCHGRPDSQPARPRLPPGCGSRTQSFPSAGAPPPLRTPDLSNNVEVIRVQLFGFKSHHVWIIEPLHTSDIKLWALTSALVDGPRLFIKVIGVRFVQVETLGGVRHRRAVLWLVWERCTRWQNWAG